MLAISGTSDSNVTNNTRFLILQRHVFFGCLRLLIYIVLLIFYSQICDPIRLDGTDSVFAASYAFNSYPKKNKKMAESVALEGPLS